MSANLKIAKFNQSVLPYKIVTDSTLTADPIIDVTQGSGTIYDMHIVVTGSDAYYLKFWLQTASVTIGTTPPDVIFKLAANDDLSINFPGGLPFTALTAAIVDTAADSDSTKTGATTVDITVVTS